MGALWEMSHEAQGSRTGYWELSHRGHNASHSQAPAPAGPDCPGPNASRNSDIRVPRYISFLLPRNKNHNPSSLKQHPLTISQSGDQKSRHGLADSSAQGLTRQKSRGWLDCVLAGGLPGEESLSKLVQVVGRI